MARKYWKLSSAGHEYVKALLEKLGWESLGYSELAQTLKETKGFIPKHKVKTTDGY